MFVDLDSRFEGLAGIRHPCEAVDADAIHLLASPLRVFGSSFRSCHVLRANVLMTVQHGSPLHNPRENVSLPPNGELVRAGRHHDGG